jgi:hypothetical protein
MARAMAPGSSARAGEHSCAQSDLREETATQAVVTPNAARNPRRARWDRAPLWAYRARRGVHALVRAAPQHYQAALVP